MEYSFTKKRACRLTHNLTFITSDVLAFGPSNCGIPIEIFFAILNSSNCCTSWDNNFKIKSEHFFNFGPFLKNQEINPAETYFHVPTLSSRVSPIGTTHEGVVPCALVRLMRQVRGPLPTWHHVGLSRAIRLSMTQTR
jgi:hypothetical protein